MARAISRNNRALAVFHCKLFKLSLRLLPRESLLNKWVLCAMQKAYASDTMGRSPLFDDLPPI
jgi:hypothetical protein